MNSAIMNDFAVDSRSLSGALQAKLSAVRAAGFSQITLCAQDIVNHPGGVDAGVAAVRASGLHVMAFQAPVNLEGTTGPMQHYKLDVVKAMLGMCAALRCRLLVLPSSSLSGGSDAVQRVCDLRRLAVLAIPMSIKIGYQGWQGGSLVKDYLQAWDLVCAADMPNLGLCLDSYGLLTSNTPIEALLEDLDMLDPDKLFLVQLADRLGADPEPWRVFPGDGDQSDKLASIVSTLHTLGYRGGYSLAAFNTDYASLPPQHVAQLAKACVLWLGQDVLQRSVPLPNQIRLRRA
ncbi:MAG: sugar phosphate isomerase/epimerase [Rhodoferax sp.]|uniref:sugar phosphate isomerase/epimerase family protein n=1 Tax=Rhodoferax sp. TaxID=50421 RepID=UPI00261843AA|nr:sugar phosphate isomerase/epimerase [Rhodoferax sp.]MDD2882441.1 sugar phosphate isomerase/epimerase [Rhodoferax sp.]